MLIHVEAFVLAFAGCVATNLDNILLVLATGSRSRARHFAMLFFVVLAAVILVAFAAALGADLVLPRSINWVGLVPLGMGLFGLVPKRGGAREGAFEAASLTAAAAVLGINSLDTLVVQAILFSDSAAPYDLTSLAGSLAAGIALAWAAFALLSHPRFAGKWMPIAAKARPWLLIAVGLLIILDTGFDTQ